MRLFATEQWDALWQLYTREKWRRAGFWIHRTALITGSRADLHLHIKGPVWLDAYSIIDIRDHPKIPLNNGELRFGRNVYIGEHCNLRAGGARIKIGDDVMVGSGARMYATNHGMELGVPMIKQAWNSQKSGVVIGSDVWLGGGSILLPGSQVGDGAVIAAGAVVTGSVPAGAIYGGVPARQLGLRKNKSSVSE